jgi:hypothetical protein
MAAAAGASAFVVLDLHIHGALPTIAGGVSLLALGGAGTIAYLRTLISRNNTHAEALLYAITTARARLATEQAELDATRAAWERQRTQDVRTGDFRLARLVRNYELRLTESARDYARLLAEHRALSNEHADVVQEYNELVIAELTARAAAPRPFPAAGSVVQLNRWQRTSHGRPSATGQLN